MQRSWRRIAGPTEEATTQPATEMVTDSKNGLARDPRVGRCWLIILGFGSVLFVVLATLAMVTVSLDDLPVALAEARFKTIDQWLSPLKYVIPSVLMILGDKVLVQDRQGRAKRVLLFWLPFFLFLVMAVVQWGFLEDAHLRFQQRNELWFGGFSAGVILLMVALPVAIVLTLVNLWVVTLLQRRTQSLQDHQPAGPG